MVENPNSNVNNNKNNEVWDLHSFHEEWFFEKVQKYIKKNKSNNIYLTLHDYMFR